MPQLNLWRKFYEWKRAQIQRSVCQEWSLKFKTRCGYISTYRIQLGWCYFVPNEFFSWTTLTEVPNCRWTLLFASKSIHRHTSRNVFRVACSKQNITCYDTISSVCLAGWLILHSCLVCKEIDFLKTNRMKGIHNVAPGIFVSLDTRGTFFFLAKFFLWSTDLPWPSLSMILFLSFFVCSSGKHNCKNHLDMFNGTRLSSCHFASVLESICHF